MSIAGKLLKSLARVSTHRIAGCRLLSIDAQQAEKPTERYPEVEHHAKLASQWWDKNGPMKALHTLNTMRVPFIRDGLIARNYVSADKINTPRVLEGLNILEVGCGGGILTEQLARIRANVTAIDLGEELINTAKQHLEEESAELSDRITYKVEPVEEHAKHNQQKYDVVVVSEVLEHITDKPMFLTSCLDALKPGGSIFVTTLNKTIPLWFGGIFLTENVFKMVPKGTHHWDMLISPLELQRILESLGCAVVMENGYTYDFMSNSWKWIPSKTFCYAVQAIKE